MANHSLESDIYSETGPFSGLSILSNRVQHALENDGNEIRISGNLVLISARLALIAGAVKRQAGNVLAARTMIKYLAELTAVCTASLSSLGGEDMENTINRAATSVNEKGLELRGDAGLICE